jgi:Flp pilus assembly protein TadD
MGVSAGMSGTTVKRTMRAFVRPSAGAAVLAMVLAVALAGCTTPSGGANTPAATVTPDAMMRVADSTRQSGNLEQAASLYTRAAQMQPTNIKPLLALGEIYGQMHSPKQAAEAWQAAIGLDPKNTTALRGLANAQLESGDAAGAIRNIRAAQAIQPDWRNNNSLGVAYDMMSDHASAQAAYRDGLTLAPGNLQLTNNLGLSLALSGDFAHALPLLEASARDPAATPRMRHNLALAYGLSGDDKKAAEIAKLDLDAAGVQENLGYYEFLRLLQDRNAIASTLGAHQADELN